MRTGKKSEFMGSMQELLRKVVIFSGKTVLTCILCLAAAACISQTAEASLTNNPYVTFSPDGNAFTTNADETNTEWYREGYTVYTGETSALREPRTGEHVYTYVNGGNVNIGKWVVMHQTGQCIHDSYPKESYYYGVYFGRNKCLRNYYSGWMPYCADCGELAVNHLFYMSEEAAVSIKQLDMSLAYYYRCPWCTNLEQAKELARHVCKKISANQYSVRYHANFGTGYMAKSVHMYGNATVYEGNEVTPQRNLNLNSYTRVGYEFVGWNTKIDGSGESFRNGAEIYNLCAEEQGSVILYAQWKRSSSVLMIDPGGGKYKGSISVYRAIGDYGSSYVLNPDDIEAPKGATVHFDTNGGTAIGDITGTMKFAEWSFTQPLLGSVEGNMYHYTGADGSVDHAKLVYEPQAIILPEPARDGYSFGGWYYDKAGTKPAGTAGDTFLPVEDVTLYAYWVDLRLVSEDNYAANGGKGAADLSWRQSDNANKTYRLYQKQEGAEWVSIHSAETAAGEKSVRKSLYYTGKKSTYTIPYSGYYRLTLRGAQGGNYAGFSGGKGGETTAVIYFKQGEVLECAVGGQNGYNGGGSGTRYGNGGGYTGVSTQAEGILLIAGGGGGASSLGNGQAGGSTLYNVTGMEGQSSFAGGGGGYRGGAGGVVNIHTHTAACRHVHSGSTEAGSGCYTVPQLCKGKNFSKEVYKETFYYGNIDNNGNRVFCVRCGSYKCPGHLNVYYHYRCLACGTFYDSKPDACGTVIKYSPGCGTQEYICGYREGQVISSQPAYGGSSYVKEQFCMNFTKRQGVNAGNGSILIESVHLGYQDHNYLNGVTATDHAAPDGINKDSVKISPVDAALVNISFEKPRDKGTTYYHKAESYNINTNKLICVSNVTANTLVSGVTGYRYCINTSTNYTVTSRDSWYGTVGDKPYISAEVKDTRQYLHIAAQDKAGNLSETVHISIAAEDIIFWPVVTEQIAVKSAENVYKPAGTGSDTGQGDGDHAGAGSGANEEVYYVKADGTTPFTVSFTGRLCGTANQKYQINQLHFLSQNMTLNGPESTLKLMVPMKNLISAGSYTYGDMEVQKQYEGAFCIEDASYTQVRRSDYCKSLRITQSFKLAPELDGSRIRLTPRAGVISADVEVMSDRTTDLGNSVWLVADGMGPVISGLEIPETDLDEDAAKWKYELTVSALDTGSGLKRFCLEIRNADNGGYEMIEDTDGDGIIELEISSEKAIFLGKYAIVAWASDNVGNESTATYGLDGIAVDAVIEKEREPQGNIFKRGESGTLKLQAYGYVERVEVTFPEEWCAENPTLDRVFIYEIPDYMQTEEVNFTVPMKIPDGPAVITVKAYKGEQMVEVDPELLTIIVEGSVLDEIRTRLR